MMPKPAFLYRQSGVIPYRRQGSTTEVLLITSATGKRWVIPKGVIERGMTAAASAAKEAFEEAGIAGAIHPESIGTYCYQKWGGICQVEAFLMEVTMVGDDWPEKNARRREWVSIAEAVERVREPELKTLIQKVA